MKGEPHGKARPEIDAARQSIRIDEDFETHSREAAALFANRARECVARTGRFDALLTGGSGPRRAYGILAEQSKLPWERIHLFWGDERMVPADHSESNFKLAYETLISRIRIPAANIHRVPTELGEPHAVAGSYEFDLRRHFGVTARSAGDANTGRFPRFDFVYLGLGKNGHVASLFPGSKLELAGPSWVIAPFVEELGRFRISVTFGVLNSAAEVVFLVSGEEKAGILAQVLSPREHRALLPAQRVRPDQGTVIWLVDRAAARELPERLITRPY